MTGETVLANAALLDAGGVLPAGSAHEDDAADTLTARVYRHPVLGDQVVVRLVPEAIGEAEDLTMEFLGFDRPQSADPVGVVRQQAPGFAGWVLVNDPANAHHALAVVKEIERLTRVAKSRIGPARDGFAAIGDKLATSVPSFLPSFYEEAARAFLAAGSPAHAAAMFGRARDAEKSYGLVVDEDRQHAAFLEFALAGALTAKALSAHARDLAGRCAPGVAYERFRRLCTERVLGGLPPYAGMHADLRRLAKSAGHGPEAEERLLTDLRAAASLARAPGKFWVAYRPALARLGRRDPAVRGWLLSFFPSDCPPDVWLAILEESGATAALTGPAGAGLTEAESPDGPTGWLTRLDDHLGHQRTRPPALYALVERMAARLKADQVPARLCRQHGLVDLNLVDLCLTLAVPVADVEKGARFRLNTWLKDETPGRRDLAALAADERMLPYLADCVENYVSSGEPRPRPEEVRAVIAVPGLRTALHWWLGQVAERLAGHGLPTLARQLDRVTRFASAEGLAVHPEAVRRIADHDVAAVLGRTLRTGVFDEYHWPALEQAAAWLAAPEAPAAGSDDDHDDDDKLAFSLSAQWPQLVVRAADRVAVVGSQVEYEHQLRISGSQNRWWRWNLRYADRQLLVSWTDWNNPPSAYWSGAPDDVFAIAGEGHATSFAASIALPDGGRTAGDRPLHAGDRDVRSRGRVMSDGQGYWTWTRAGDGPYGWHEFDPATGRLGRPSLPAFLEDGAVDGQPLSLEDCRLLPVPAELADSPLGSRDGLVGWRVRRTPDGGLAGEAPDGRSFALPGPAWAAVAADGHDSKLLGAIRFPGSDAACGVVRADRYSCTIRASDGFDIGQYSILAQPSWFRRYPTSSRPGGFCAGIRYLMPPTGYWHYLRARDEAGSAALRACTDEVARSLLDGALRGGSGRDGGSARDGDDVVSLVRNLLPAVRDQRLAMGIAGVVAQAATSARRLAKLGTALAGQAPEREDAEAAAEAEAAAAGLPSDSALHDAIRVLLPTRCSARGYRAIRMFRQAGALLTAPEPDLAAARSLPDGDWSWWSALAVVRAAMYRAVSPATPAQHRSALLGWLRVCADSGLLARGGRLRLLKMFPDDGQQPVKKGDLIQVGTRRILVLRCVGKANETWAVDYAPDGTFGAVPGFRLASQQAYGDPGVTSETLLAFIALAREHGPLAWRPELPAALSASAGLSLAEATAVLAGLPSAEAWKQEGGVNRGANGSVTDEALAMAERTWCGNRPVAVRIGVLGSLLPEDPPALWTAGPAVARLTACLTGHRGARTPVDDTLIIAAHQAGIAPGMGASEVLHGIANPGTCRWLHGRVPGLPGAVFLEVMVHAIPWVADTLPGDHPVRRALPAVLELARSRLADPEFTIEVGHVPSDQVPRLLAGLGVPVTSGEHGTTAGPVHVAPDHWASVRVRPALLTSPDDPLVAAVRERIWHFDERPLGWMRALLSESMTTWATYVAPTAAVGAEHDPSRAAPGLVTEVAAARELSADAATLYLQILALTDPTDRNVAAWTGWKPARLKAARAELAGTSLVVAGKRARTRRSLFLPGGWIARKPPLPPAEAWKQPLALAGIADAIIPVAPVPLIFEVAWQRVRDGDGPRLDELDLGRRR